MGNGSSLMLQHDEIQEISDETNFSASQIEKLYSRFAQLDRNNCGALSKIDLLSIPELAINPLCDRLIHLFFADCDPQDERINFRQFMRVLAAFRSSTSLVGPPTSATAAAAAATSASTSHKVIHNQHHSNNPTRRHHSNQSVKCRRQLQEDTRPHQQFTGNHTQMAHIINELASAAAHRRRSNFRAPRNYADSDTDRSPSTSSSLSSSSSSSDILDAMSNNLKRKLMFVFQVYDADNDGRISYSDLRSILKMMVGTYIEELQLDKIATRAFHEADQDSDGYIEFDEFCRVFAGKNLNDKLRVKFYN